MLTKSYGEAFEKTVLAALTVELEGGRLGLAPSHAKIFHRKKYFSRDRNSNIVVDVSIELWLPGSKHYSLLWVFECKDYAHSIPVDDVEEFKAKLDQIAGKNVKGVIVTRNALQKSALSYAQSNGIAVVRMIPDDQVKWVMPSMIDLPGQTQFETNELSLALTCETYLSRNRSLYGMYDGLFLSDWLSLLSHMIKELEQDGLQAAGNK